MEKWRHRASEPMPFMDAANAISRFEIGGRAVEVSGHERAASTC
jgi:hypothetical protein